MSSADQLRSIHTFKDLVRYLEEQLGWPLEQYGFDDLTFVYEPAELGLKEEDAAKVRTIHQLRPLEHGQPLGIFFIDFEKKKLPVVVLRRILSHLVIKKRASASKSDAKRWQASDLIFISSFGDEGAGQREIAFAHFHQPEGDMPTLRVLGWDGADTPLKLEHVAATLKEKLRWPADTADHDTWRRQWSSPFRHRIGHTIRTADALAEELAALAKRIRNAAQRLMKAESDRGPLTKLFKAFQAALIHDLTEETFADTYAQTITYGLLTAAINRTDMSGGREATYVKADDLTLMVRVTSPFLKEMLETFLTVGGRKNGVDFDELGIQDVVELLRGDETDLPEILRNFGDKKPGEDPVIHFYEHFLSAYNKKLKIQRGVFYTPQPVVSYIVRSVHELLQTEFGLEDGLASTVTWGEMLKKHPGLKLPPLSDEPGDTRTISPDEPFVQILDPATGTATFLVEVVDVIHRTLVAKWKKQGRLELEIPKLWNEYVPKHLLPRLHGYELLAAPYAIAHLKLGLKLTETGYRFGSDERARIYLTNSLEPKVRQLPQIGFEPLAHEAKAVNEIKWYKRFTVVIGNPPYAGISSNMSNYAQSLVDAYKIVDGQALNERKHWLQDDYVKFLRLSQMILDVTKTGLLGFITNHGFLDNPTFRGMRQSLLGSFTKIFGYDLHGSTKKADLTPPGVDDQNVFDIQQGVSITLAVCGKTKPPYQFHHADLWGDWHQKYQHLQSSSVTKSRWQNVSPSSPYYFFVPKDLSNLDEYQSGFPVTEIMPEYVNGIVTARDGFVVDFEDDPIKERIAVFLDSRLSDAEVKEKLGLSENYAWRVRDARKDLRACPDWEGRLMNILYRPFDLRRIIYHASVVWRTRNDIMRHMIVGKNLGLCTNRLVNGEFRHVGATRDIINDCTISLATKERTYLFPLWLYPDKESADLLGHNVLRPNFGSSFLKALSATLGITHKGAHGLPAGLSPEDIFHYAYGVFHSPGYRSRYAEFLKIDFPRLPLTGNLELFRALARLGGELVALHLLESPKLDHPITEYLGGRAPEIEKVSWSKNTVWLDKEQTAGFKGVREDVWNFHIGGYQVCEKWLKDRKGRTLSTEDRAHYQKIVVALSETIRLMKEIDAVIERHGGWPIK